jgi:hypothetical protein
MARTYSLARLIALQEKAHRLHVLVRDASERCQEAQDELNRALLVRDTGSATPAEGFHGPVVHFPDEREQRRREEVVGEIRARRDRLRAERDDLARRMRTLASLSARCERFVKEGEAKKTLEARDKPPPEPSEFFKEEELRREKNRHRTSHRLCSLPDPYRVI